LADSHMMVEYDVVIKSVYNICKCKFLLIQLRLVGAKILYSNDMPFFWEALMNFDSHHCLPH